MLANFHSTVAVKILLNVHDYDTDQDIIYIRMRH